jgi:hypothetical protein
MTNPPHPQLIQNRIEQVVMSHIRVNKRNDLFVSQCREIRSMRLLLRGKAEIRNLRERQLNPPFAVLGIQRLGRPRGLFHFLRGPVHPNLALDSPLWPPYRTADLVPCRTPLLDCSVLELWKRRYSSAPATPRTTKGVPTVRKNVSQLSHPLGFRSHAGF